MDRSFKCRECQVELAGGKSYVVMPQGVRPRSICVDCVVKFTSQSGVPQKLTSFVTWYVEQQKYVTPQQRIKDLERKVAELQLLLNN